jgi:hypothetical protein
MYSALADLGLLLCVLAVVASAIAFWKDVRDLRKRHPPQDRGFEVILAKQQGEALNVQPLSDHGEPGPVGDDDVHKLHYAGLDTKSPLSATVRRLIAGAAVILAAAPAGRGGKPCPNHGHFPHDARNRLSRCARLCRGHRRAAVSFGRTRRKPVVVSDRSDGQASEV